MTRRLPSILLSIVFILVMLYQIPNASAITLDFNYEPYFTADNGCITTWACTLWNPGPQSQSYISSNLNQAYTIAECQAAYWCNAEVWQGKKPFGWGQSPYNMPPVKFTGTEGSRYLQLMVKQQAFICSNLWVCQEHIFVEFWSDFAGMSACRQGLCSTNGVVEIMLVYGVEGWGGNVPTWIWHDLGPGLPKWWQYTVILGSNLVDGRWYSWNTALHNYFVAASNGVGRDVGQGYAWTVNCGVEDYYARGSFVDWDTCRFYAIG